MDKLNAVGQPPAEVALNGCSNRWYSGTYGRDTAAAQSLVHPRAHPTSDHELAVGDHGQQRIVMPIIRIVLASFNQDNSIYRRCS